MVDETTDGGVVEGLNLEIMVGRNKGRMGGGVPEFVFVHDNPKVEGMRRCCEKRRMRSC